MNNEEKIINVFKELNTSNIRYCHFKSNANLDISFQGKTDFDIIINKNDMQKFKQILLKFGFKQRYVTYDKMYVCMEDFLLYDEKQDVIHHFHVHYELMFGKKLEKRYYFNIDFEKYLIFNKEYNIYILQPEIELIFLVLRLIFKNQIKLKYILRKSKMKIADSARRELEELLIQIDTNLFETLLNENFNDIKESVYEFIKDYKDDRLNLLKVYRLSKFIEKNVTNSLVIINSDSYSPLLKIKKESTSNSYRWLQSGGKSISIIGVDGSGKSTLVKDLDKFLRYKLTTEKLYLGKVGTFKLKVLKFIAKQFRNIGLKSIRSYINSYAQYYAAQTKYNIFMKTKSNSKLGIISVIDRYPLKEFFSMNDPMDGPKLTKNDNNNFRELELKEFSKIDNYPDILIILDIDLQTSISRKSEHQKIQKRLQEKIDAIKSIDINKIDTVVVKIDATQEYQKVLSEVKSFVWNNI